jgi:multisubunit Na+/H+ antiporter MnhC subunit
MTLRRLLIIHALPTFAAGLVLILAPSLIPSVIGISISPNAYLVCYLLGAAELAIAFLSFFAKDLHDRQSLRLIALTFIIFHLATALVEIYAYAQGIHAAVWANVALRVIVAALFYHFGLRKAPKEIIGV